MSPEGLSHHWPPGSGKTDTTSEGVIGINKYKGEAAIHEASERLLAEHGPKPEHTDQERAEAEAAAAIIVAAREDLIASLPPLSDAIVEDLGDPPPVRPPVLEPKPEEVRTAVPEPAVAPQAARSRREGAARTDYGDDEMKVASVSAPVEEPPAEHADAKHAAGGHGHAGTSHAAHAAGGKEHKQGHDDHHSADKHAHDHGHGGKGLLDSVKQFFKTPVPVLFEIGTGLLSLIGIGSGGAKKHAAPSHAKEAHGH